MIISDEIRGFLLSSGADLVGFANLQDISSDARDSLPFGVSIAVALNPHIISKIKDGPTGDYYKEYERANRLLDKLGYLAVYFFEKYLPAIYLMFTCLFTFYTTVFTLLW